MRERPNRHAWKACEGQPSEGSNPSPSAMSSGHDTSDASASDIASMCAALNEAEAALRHDDVPVGAIVVRDGVTIAARHNERELTGDPVAHAEVLALRDAAAVVGHWRLDDCTLYVTLEPCAMCAGAMVNARLGRLVFGADDPKAGAATSHYRLLDGSILNHEVAITSGIEAEACGTLLRSFFRARRN